MVAHIVPEASKLLVTLNTPGDIERVRATGAKVLVEYPDAILVQATAAQTQRLQEDKLEFDPLESQPIQVAGVSFEFQAAAAAERTAPQPTLDPRRTAYYLVRLVGPAKGEWLDYVRAIGGSIQSDLPGFTLLIGLQPDKLDVLQTQPWVEGITPYRPEMKLAPALRQGRVRVLNAADLAAAPAMAPDAQQVEISLFRGESAADLAALVRSNDGTVLKETPTSVTALLPANALAVIAKEVGVQAILPHSFPKFHNNVATTIMEVPASRVFGTFDLGGQGQIVAIADSGLDSGDSTHIHADFTGRISALVSFPTAAGLSGFVKDAPGHDDGPADVHSGHGTHVAGSVLGSGAAAIAAGSAVVPAGTAPQASLYFQAVEQKVRWKSRAELIAAGTPPAAIPPDWPPPASGLYGLPDDLADLLRPAYLAGARIHTNSWGSNNPGVYDENARQIDEFLWTHRDMLVLVSGGNDGLDQDEDGVIDAGSIGPPSTAKNCVAVGASENLRPGGSVPAPGIDANWNTLGGPGPTGAFELSWPHLGPAGHVSDNAAGMAAFSSRGPTEDGRIKPDVVAPGTNILSVRSSVYAGASQILWGEVATAHPLHNLYCWSGGTSMSAPLVAGAVALIRQHLVNNLGHVQDGIKPSGALLKALLVNGATAMAGNFVGEIPAGNNSVSGFGRVDVAATLAALNTAQFDDTPARAVAAGQMRVYSLTGVDTTRPLKVTLVWTDAGGAVGNGGLVNKLYLQVVLPDGTIRGGDVTAFPNVVNNVQQVTIATPAAGSYQIRVRGIAIVRHSPAAPGTGTPRLQDFALVTSNGTALTTP